MKGSFVMKQERSFSKARYEELKSFCRQYGEKKAALQSISLLSSQSYNGIPRSGVNDPTYSKVQRREQLEKDIELIENCAADVEQGDFYKALIANCCFSKPYDCIMELLPAYSRNAFFAARFKFFELLNIRKGGYIPLEAVQKKVVHW